MGRRWWLRATMRQRVGVSIASSALVHVLVAIWLMRGPTTPELPAFEGVSISIAPEAPAAEPLAATSARAPDVKNDPATATAAKQANPPMDAPTAAMDARRRRSFIDAHTAMAQAATQDAAVDGPRELGAATNGGATSDANIGSLAPTDSEAGPPPSPGTMANLSTYMPRGHVMTAMIRFDRLRGTPWQAAAERLLAPTPDYRMLVGDRALRFTDLFETFVISTSDPRDALATTLLARFRGGRSKLREILTTRETPVRWYAGKGGLIGQRSPGARVPTADQRVFVSPLSDWIMLAQPTDVSAAVVPTSGDPDTAITQLGLPTWLRIEREAGVGKSGPALVLTFTEGKSFSPRGAAGRTLGTPVPQHGTFTMELVDGGFVVRGNLTFATDADAAAFVSTLLMARDRALKDTKVLLAVSVAGGLNAARGLSLRQFGARVSYATSISGADATTMFRLVERSVMDYFKKQRP